MIRKMGDKQSARALMKKNDVPLVPGSDGILSGWHDAAAAAEKTGYPVLIKASAGGGGRGMRIANSASDIKHAFEEAQAEAVSAFGNGNMYLEKLILHPHHVEVQILGDSKGHIIHLGERDCSMQRRNQKMLEESPAYILTERQREGIRRAAIKAAKAVHYVSAGTVEFVIDTSGKYYFIEMNTRVQVEHPVTEMVTGVDIIKEQIRIAAGLPLSIKQNDVHLNGHAIECRINAEDVEHGFAPCPGKIDFLHFPCGNGVRVESALYNGARISPYYDSMIAKIIVKADTRLAAIRKMRVALEELTIEGVKSNADFLYLLMFNEEFVTGKIDTGFLSENADAIVRWANDSKYMKKSGKK